MLFYVYEHWRPDTDVCFWVGKGKGRRAYVFKRNSRYNRTVAKLARLGMCVEVRMVAEALSEAEAFRIECERIAFWRARGDQLANATNGGEGVSGLKWSAASRAVARKAKLGIPLSAKHRENIGRSNKGRKVSAETRAKLTAWRTGRKQGPLSQEHREKIGASSRGRVDPPETREKKRLASLKKAPLSATARQQISRTVKTLWLDPDYRARMVAAHIGHEPTAEAKANMKSGQARRGSTRPQTHREAISAGLKAAWKRRKAQLEGAS